MIKNEGNMAKPEEANQQFAEAFNEERNQLIRELSPLFKLYGDKSYEKFEAKYKENPTGSASYVINLWDYFKKLRQEEFNFNQNNQPIKTTPEEMQKIVLETLEKIQKIAKHSNEERKESWKYKAIGLYSQPGQSKIFDATSKIIKQIENRIEQTPKKTPSAS